MIETDRIVRACLSWDPAFAHDRSALVLIQKKETVRDFEFGELPITVRKWYEVRDISVLKGDYLRQSDEVISRWIKTNGWYRQHRVPVSILVDAAGVGISVVQTLRSRALLAEVTPSIRAYSFVASNTPMGYSHNTLRLDKISVYEHAYSAMATGQLKIDSKIPLAKELRQELENLQVTNSQSGRPLINAASGSYDDLVTATVAGLAYLDLKGEMRAIPSIF